MPANSRYLSDHRYEGNQADCRCGKGGTLRDAHSGIQRSLGIRAEHWNHAPSKQKWPMPCGCADRKQTQRDCYFAYRQRPPTFGIHSPIPVRGRQKSTRRHKLSGDWTAACE
jgi:hypothetical protein